MVKRMRKLRGSWQTASSPQPQHSRNAPPKCTSDTLCHPYPAPPRLAPLTTMAAANGAPIQPSESALQPRGPHWRTAIDQAQRPMGVRRRQSGIVAAFVLNALSCHFLACQQPDDARAPPPTTRRIENEQLGLALSLPLTWQGQKRSGAHVFSGPKGSQAYFTTITLQAARPGAPTLREALTVSFADLRSTSSDFRWAARNATNIDGHAALAYEVRFKLHDKRRRKSGVLIDRGDHVLDVSYAATSELYPRELPTFQAAVASLSLRQPDGQPVDVIEAMP